MTIETLLTQILNLINAYLIPLMVGLAILALFWGIVQYIFSASSPTGKADGMKIMSAGIIGLVVMLSIWGIVALVSNSFGVSGARTLTLPTVH